MSNASVEQGDFVAYVFLQVDLGGHSAWSAKHPSIPTVFRLRKSFAKSLAQQLANGHQFESIFWAGDGGLFARKFRRAEDAESVCAAADSAFAIFTDCFENNDELTFRVTATCIPDVVVDEERGNWFSSELNEFLKYERQLASPNAFVITDKLRKRMDAESYAFKRFADQKSRSVHFLDTTITIYSDSEHPVRVTPARYRFSEWLKNAGIQYSNRQPAIGWIVDDSIILGTALERSGYGHIDLVQIEPSWQVDDISGEHGDAWRHLTAKYRDLGGTKASVQTLQQPLSEDPVLRLEWRAVPFPLVRAFHELVETDQEFSNSYSSLAVAERQRKIPSVLVVHSLLILESANASLQLVFAHRKKGPRRGGYVDNCWSAGFEEQFAPVQSFWGGRARPRDLSLHDTAVRGVREEFVGEHFGGTISVAFHAVQLEQFNFNLSILAAVRVSDLTFKELISLWPNAVDYQEHDALVAVPFNAEAIDACLRADFLLPDLLAGQNAATAHLSDGDHSWHPSSKARLNLAKWLLETAA
jgi:hypothetical protein